jgi:hypothetical protein
MNLAACEFCAHVQSERLELRLSIEAPRDPRLVRDDNNPKSLTLEPEQRLDHARQKFEVFDSMRVARIAIDHPVAVDEECRPVRTVQTTPNP